MKLNLAMISVHTTRTVFNFRIKVGGEFDFSLVSGFSLAQTIMLCMQQYKVLGAAAAASLFSL